MKRSRFSDEQIIAILKEHENGAKMDELRRGLPLIFSMYFRKRELEA